MDLTDREYVERSRNGNPDDFRFLVLRYQGPVFAFVAGRLGNRTLAREAAQESFVRAFFALGKLQKPEAFHAWLLGIAGRVALEFQRTVARRKEDGESAETVAVPASDPEDDIQLEEAIAALPDAYRQLILLRYFEQLSCQEIAERVQMPLGSVTKTLSRAYAALRQILEPPTPTEITARLEKKS
jgi:RNA polymerase sigma-70 factor (ECF subfamily)